MKLVLNLHVRFRGYHYIAQTSRPWVGREPVHEQLTVEWTGPNGRPLFPKPPTNLASLTLLRRGGS